MTDEERNEQNEERDDEERDDEDRDEDESQENEGSSGDDSGDSDGDSGGDSGGGGGSGSKVGDIMTKDPQTVEPGDSIEDAAAKMKEADAGAMLVVDGDELKGIVTDRDISNAVGEGNSDAKVEDVASTEPATIEPDASLGDAVQLMREHDVRRLPVVEDGKLVGIVSLGDLASAADDDSALKDISEAEPNA